MSIKAIIWDFGGVLVRTEDHQPRQEAASRLGLSESALEALVFESPSAQRALLGEISTNQHWDNIGAELGLSESELVSLRKAFFAGDRLDEDLINTIQELRRAYRMALLSNAWDSLRQALNEILHIGHIFDEIIISSEVGLVKPNSKIYQLALKCLDLTPQEAIFIDDFIENIQGANQLGLFTVHFRSRDQALADLKQWLTTL